MKLNAFSVSSYLIKLAIAIALSFSVVYAITETAGLSVPPGVVLLYCAAFLVAFSILFLNLYTANGIILSSVLVFSIWLFFQYRADTLDNLRQESMYHIRRFTYWIANFFYFGTPRNARYEFAALIAICALVCLAAYFITIKKYCFALIFLLGFVTFSVQWSYGFRADDISVFVFIAAVVVSYIWHIYLKNTRVYGIGAALYSPLRFFATLIPLSAVVIIVVTLIPTPDSPIRVQWVYDIANSITEQVNDNFYYHRVDSFGLNTTGFTRGESFLSGPVRLNNAQVMTVTTDDDTLYLKGNGKGIYTGKSWRNANPGEEGNNAYAYADADLGTGVDAGADLSADAGIGADSDAGETVGADYDADASSSVDASSGVNGDYSLTAGSDAESGTDTNSDINPNDVGGNNWQFNFGNRIFSEIWHAGTNDYSDIPDKETALSTAEEKASAAAAGKDTEAAGKSRPGLASDELASVEPASGEPTSGESTDGQERGGESEEETEPVLSQYDADEKSEVVLDEAEYRQNHILYPLRLLGGRAAVMRSRQTMSAETLSYVGRQMYEKNEKTASIRFDRMKTYSLFTTGKLSSIDNFNMDTGALYEDGGALTMENMMTEGFSYNISYYPEDTEPTSLLLLHNSHQGLYRELLNDYDGHGIMIIGRRANMIKISDLIKREELFRLAERAYKIRETYTGLPEALPERVRALAQTLTEGVTSDFDKARILERFLYSNYGYSLDVGYLRDGSDFVDTFLFEMSDGYCTHFASALAILARCVGLPSRYVEGYILPAENGGENVYLVSNMEAHAWVEIYFEGYGWRRFEPTATYQEQTSEDSLTANDAAATPTPGVLTYIPGIPRDIYGNNPGTALTQIDGANVQSDGGEAFAEAAKRLLLAIVAVLLTIAAFVPIIAVIYGRHRDKKRAAGFDADEPERAVTHMYSHYLKILRRLKYTISKGETLSQFAARVDNSLDIGSAGLTSALSIFEKLAYSKQSITVSDSRKVRNLYPRLLSVYSRRKSRISYFFAKDILADI